MEEEIKKKTTFWIYPSMLRKMDGMLEADNCASRSEFVEKALRFYIGYLESNNAADYLCEVLGALISGILTDNGNRIRSLLFKWCVELNMTCHTVAAHFRADEIDRRGRSWRPTGRSASTTRWMCSGTRRRMIYESRRIPAQWIRREKDEQRNE